jgi:collagen beta-1,O-galactosyltransferase
MALGVATPLFCLLVSLLEVAVSSSGSQLQDAGPSGVGSGVELPVVMVGILARNTAHTLPNFLGYFENLDYPKDRISVW